MGGRCPAACSLGKFRAAPGGSSGWRGGGGEAGAGNSRRDLPGNQRSKRLDRAGGWPPRLWPPEPFWKSERRLRRGAPGARGAENLRAGAWELGNFTRALRALSPPVTRVSAEDLADLAPRLLLPICERFHGVCVMGGEASY